MKPKSVKLRFLATLHAVFKHTDENHRLNCVKLNEILKPYGLDCDRDVVKDSIAVMRNFGLNIQEKGAFNKRGFWLENRPLSEEKLNALIFAVSTNPHISEEQVTDILSSLAPFVTIYQEPLLKSYVVTTQDYPLDTELINKHRVICDAIAAKRRIRYDVTAKNIYMTAQKYSLFTPKYIHQVNNRLYMVGYNNSRKKTEAVDIQTMTDIKLSTKHKDPFGEEVQKILDSINPNECIEQIRGPLIYKGKITFKCRAPYIKYLYRIFGEPESPVNTRNRWCCEYTVPEAEIWAKTLFELSSIPNQDILIVATPALSKAVKDYYSSIAEILIRPQ